MKIELSGDPVGASFEDFPLGTPLLVQRKYSSDRKDGIVILTPTCVLWLDSEGISYSGHDYLQNQYTPVRQLQPGEKITIIL